MPTIPPPEVHEGRDGRKQVYILLNWLRRQANVTTYVVGAGSGELTMGAPNGTAIVFKDQSGNVLGALELNDFTINP